MGDEAGRIVARAADHAPKAIRERGRVDERFMQRALEVAQIPPFTLPNPRVGAVVMRDGNVLGEGAHEGPGTPHAERRALEAVHDAAGATVYLVLEPCVHHGRTPPCAPLLRDAGIASVVIALEDPDPRVRGRGIEYLRSHGVEVVVGVLSEQARHLNRQYLHHRITGRPYVTLKLALTLDGRLAASDGSSRFTASRSVSISQYAAVCRTRRT
jgi:diaminohydroxyphosphoribosylaminopyrimidine deaminase / 5-amino-6-(5-phosphoribosylamino)uracil reductase